MNDRIEKLKAYLQQTPNDCFLNHALALEYVKMGDEAAARACFEKNLGNDPTYVATYYHLAKLLERVGEPQQAVQLPYSGKGMEEARAAKDVHTYSELQAAYEDIVN